MGRRDEGATVRGGRSGPQPLSAPASPASVAAVRVRYRSTPTSRSLRVADALLVGWVLVWTLMGLAVASEIRTLTQLSDTVVTAGGAVRSTGSALRGLEQLPLIGGLVRDRVEQMAGQAQRAGDQAVASGEASRRSIHRL